MKRTAITLILTLCTLCASLAVSFPPMKKLNYAGQIIEGYYVDSVDSEAIAESAIIAMLKNSIPTRPTPTPRKHAS